MVAGAESTRTVPYFAYKIFQFCVRVWKLLIFSILLPDGWFFISPAILHLTLVYKYFRLHRVFLYIYILR